ncbi:MAG: 50S ribosomal protein L6 [Candidatus Pacearchaeota archaeon]|nr:50S ribosomal protein L6 [Candidatus Pacearchaeota archaeon]
MKKQYVEELEIPSGIECEIIDKTIKCKKGSVVLEKKLPLLNINLTIKDNKIILFCKKGNKNDYKKIKSFIAHIKNLFEGLTEKYVYKLEAVFVHFPMTLKIEGNKLIINNFLGEKTPRYAEILPNVDVEIKGQKITISSHDKDAAGQTAANFERATKIRNRDRRIFQDGIFIVEKPGVKK